MLICSVIETYQSISDWSLYSKTALHTNAKCKVTNTSTKQWQVVGNTDIVMTWWRFRFQNVDFGADWRNCISGVDSNLRCSARKVHDWLMKSSFGAPDRYVNVDCRAVRGWLSHASPASILDTGAEWMMKRFEEAQPRNIMILGRNDRIFEGECAVSDIERELARHGTVPCMLIWFQLEAQLGDHGPCWFVKLRYTRNSSWSWSGFTSTPYPELPEDDELRSWSCSKAACKCIWWWLTGLSSYAFPK